METYSRIEILLPAKVTYPKPLCILLNWSYTTWVSSTRPNCSKYWASRKSSTHLTRPPTKTLRSQWTWGIWNYTRNEWGRCANYTRHEWKTTLETSGEDLVYTQTHKTLRMPNVICWPSTSSIRVCNLLHSFRVCFSIAPRVISVGAVDPVTLKYVVLV